ncbi:hypothetical protein EJ110_NYTH56177 [Nymphaea thermarum]|nr:hypothetical protein EJ110_NYTH56177 [Nymphaea thermarum]
MASKPVDEEDLVMNILSGPPTDEYGTLKVSLRTRVNPINLEELYSLLLIQESENSKPGNLEDPSAYVAHRQNFKNPNYCGKNEQQRGRPGIRPQDKKVSCNACGIRGHFASQCRTICQACRKSGHGALNCKAGVDSFSSARRRRLTGASRRLIGASCRHPIVVAPAACCLHVRPSTSAARRLHIRSSPSAARRRLLLSAVFTSVVFSCRRPVARLLPSSPVGRSLPPIAVTIDRRLCRTSLLAARLVFSPLPPSSDVALL